MEILRKNVNKDGICLLGSRQIGPKQRIRFSKTKMKLICQKYCHNSSEVTFFSDVLCVSRPVCIKCLSRKAKNLQTKYNKVAKRCFNLNRQANYRPQGEFDDRAEEGIYVVIFSFLSIFSLGFLILFYSTIPLLDTVIVLGQPLKICGIIKVALSNEIKVP